MAISSVYWKNRTCCAPLFSNPDSYGRQQWGIFRNGRKPDGAMQRGGRRPTGHELLFPEKNK
ncbi:hypothetical protein BVRB_7g164560 [Beta vulgaris subsp. vulgaris]|nr:hypothetical protein BVRB_7g164560 [Beta vulgaris subsp. vulgaris]